VKILLDTSVLVAGIVKTHSSHSRAIVWLQKANDRAFDGVIAAHSMAELYSVITALPLRPRILPGTIQELIKHDLLNVFQIVSLSEQDYVTTIDHMTALGLIGGAIFDALIMQAAVKANVDQIVTFNTKDFQRVNPSLADRIVSP